MRRLAVAVCVCWMVVSDADGGKTFPHRLDLDMCGGVSYPDVSEWFDGLIHCVYDFDRRNVGEIILDQFTEEDIRTRRIVSSRSRRRRIVRKNASQ